MAASLSGLSASVTRILFLTGFNKDLKTKDIQSAFHDYEHSSGGFKIKWKDDTSLLIVFNDPTVAKRAYLHTLAYPPAALGAAVLKPYDGPDAQAIIQAVNSRSNHHPSASRSHSGRAASISVLPGARSNSGSSNHGTNNNHRNAIAALSAQHIAIPEHPSTAANNGREPSPTLPSLPAHPTLNALISSSLGEAALTSDPAILVAGLQQPSTDQANGPRIGDPGKRMLGAALGVRHPGLGPRTPPPHAAPQNGAATNGNAGVELTRVLAGLSVAE